MRELSLNILDIVQNSIAAGASLVAVGVEERTVERTLLITVEDDGHGMTPQQLAEVQSPFYTTRTTRPVGLGIPLFKMACQQTGGDFSIRSAPGEGTRVRALFHTDHIDMTPLGDINETVLLLVTTTPGVDVLFTRRRDTAAFTLDTRQLRETLDGVPLSDPAVVAWVRDYLAEGQAELAASGETGCDS